MGQPDAAGWFGFDISGHQRTFVELGRLPCAGFQHIAQNFHGVPHIGKARIQRCETEAHDARLAVVADHAARDQRLHHGIAVGVFVADMAAADGVVTRRDERERKACAARFHQRDEEVGERQRLGAQGGHRRLREDVEPAFHHRHRRDRLRAAQEAADAGIGVVARLHRERPRMAPPAGQRLPEAFAQRGRHPHEGRRARAAIQVFVGAADGVIRAACVQVNGHSARRMRQIPDGQRAVLVRQRRDGRHVVHVPALVVHVRQHGDGDVVAQRAFQLFRRVDQAQFVAVAQQVGQAFSDVEVGRKVMRFRHDDLAGGRVFALHANRGGQHLEEIDRCGVGDDDFVFARTNQRGKLVAQAARQLKPAGLVPAADQAIAPFIGDDFLRAGERSFRAGAQRVAVEINRAVGQRKGVAQRGDRIGRVAFDAGVAGDGHVNAG